MKFGALHKVLNLQTSVSYKMKTAVEILRSMVKQACNNTVILIILYLLVIGCTWSADTFFSKYSPEFKHSKSQP